MDQNPNVLITQQPSPSSKFKRPSYQLVIIVLILGLIAGLGYYFLPQLLKTSPNLSRTTKSPREIRLTESNLEKVQVPVDEVAIVTINVKPASPAAYIKTEKAKFHLPLPLESPPKEEPGSFVFKADLIAKQGQLLYSSWKSYPIITKSLDKAFEVKTATPYQKDAILKLSDLKNKSIIIVTLP